MGGGGFSDEKAMRDLGLVLRPELLELLELLGLHAPIHLMRRLSA